MKTTYKLGKDITVILEGCGQNHPNTNNKVIVKLTIKLPVNLKSSNLCIREDLMFGNHIQILDEHLGSTWGTVDSDGQSRQRHGEFYAKTWKEAKAKAAKTAKENADNLYALIEKRKQALKDAGDWE